jgi:uncharacterized membrane protein YfcA
MELDSFLGIVGIFIVAGAVKGVSGMGLPTVAMSLLSIVVSPGTAAGLLVVPSLATNVLQCWGPYACQLIRRFWLLWLCVFVGAWWSPLPPVDRASGARALLGAVLLVYGVWGLFKSALPSPGQNEGWISPVVGYVAGVLTAATGVFVMPLTPYLQALGLEKDQLVQALGISFTVCTLALASRLTSATVASATLSWIGLASLCASIAGLWAGTAIRKRIDRARFRQILFAVFALLGALMLWGV